MQKKKAEIWVFHRLAWLWLGGTRPRDCLPDRARLNTNRACHGARPGPKLAPSYTRTPCVPRTQEREERPEVGREIVADVQKNVHFVHIHIRLDDG